MMRAMTVDGSMFATTTLSLAGMAEIRLLPWPALMPLVVGALRLAMSAGLGLAVGVMTPMPLFWIGVGLLTSAVLQRWVRP